ncbi:MAG: hypothetical protein L3K05_03810 [Thermoplasmata archaeon]|nr:hypothetical protein [Thermoplasmata archaeon]
MIAVMAAVLLLAVPGVPLPGILESAAPTDPPPSRSPPPSGDPPVSNSPSPLACNRVTTPTPSSILVPVAGPSRATGRGGSVGATFEFSVANATSRQSGITVEVPSVFAAFPLSGGGSTSIYFGPRSFPLTGGGGWLNGSRSSATLPAPNGLAFAANATALLSSQKIAVLADTPYGSVTLEVRWQWTVTTSNGSTTTGAWSVPTSSSGWPASVPSIFEPAPAITRLWESGPNASIGSNFTARLGGNVSARYFFLELESASTGKVAQDHGLTSSAGASSATVTIVLLNYDRYLYPGNYLVHIHDACGALLMSLPVNASYASSATLTDYLQPATCGPVTFNGVSYANGRSFSVAPASTPYAVTVPSCSGHSFHGWHFSGGLYLSSSNKILVSSSGSFTVVYS